MSKVSTSRFGLAAGATAALALLLVVPTVLHFADPAFGQGSGSGYTVFTPAPSGVGGTVNVTQNVGPVKAGAQVTVVLFSEQPVQPASTPVDAALLASIVASPQKLQEALADAAQAKSVLGDANAVKTLLSDPAARAVLLKDPKVVAAAPAALEVALKTEGAREAIVKAVKEDATLLKAGVSDAATLKVLLADAETSKIVIQKTLGDEATFNALLSSPAAVGQMLANDEAREQIMESPQRVQQVLGAVLSERKVSEVRLTAAQDASNVKVVVQEYLPTDKTQTAVNTAPGQSLANIQLTVAVPQTGADGTQTVEQVSFKAMKVLEVHADGLAKGGVAGATIGFHLSNAEMLVMGVKPADVQMLHQVDGKMVPLPTRIVGTTADGVDFEADTPSFSYFVIASRQAAADESTGMGALGVTAIVLGIAALVVVAAVVVKRRKA